MAFEVSEDRYWLPVHTKPRCEKKFLLFCDKYDVKAYLPLKIKLRTKGRALIKSELPMFPGYAFAWMNVDEKNKLAKTNSIVNYISMNREQEKKLCQDLESIKILEKMQATEELFVSPEIQSGREVLISSGPLRGLNGIVEKRKTFHRVIVNVEMISHSVKMEMDVADLELDI